MADYDVFARHPILGAWRDRVRQVVGPHYETAHRVVREFTAKYGGVPPLKGWEEEIWLDDGEKKFLIGDEITVADQLPNLT